MILGSGRVGIIQYCRNAVAGSFAQFDVTLYNCLEYQFLKMAFHFIINLVGAEIEMLNLEDREKIMKKVLAPMRDEYDYILIDCSPSLGLITINALTAADSVIIPVQCEYFALEGISKLLNTIKIIKSKLNPSLEIEGFLLTMFGIHVCVYDRQYIYTDKTEYA